MIETVAFDADDTLWYGEVHYQNTQAELKILLSTWEDPDKIDKILYDVEMQNLPLYGYGVKAFVLSMIEAAIIVSGGKVSGKEIEKILTFGRDMLKSEVVLRPHVRQTLELLAKEYRLILITKGDLLDQTAKLARSGLSDFFFLVEVVNEKTPDTYKHILDKNQLSPGNLLMVGNSIRSDILPVLELGIQAVHIPADTTWEHEVVPDFDTSQKGYHLLDHIGQLPDFLKNYHPHY